MLCHEKEQLELYDINELQRELGTMKHRLLFIHAMTGCDTTSALYNQGKCKALKLARAKTELHPLMDVFMRASSSHDDVASAGERFMLALYGADKFASLNKYINVAYKRGVARTSLSSSFQLSSIPPTSAAARQHSYRVYLQIQEWMGQSLTPTEWGWQDHDQTIVPVATDQPAAPRQLMNIVTCGCKTGCGNACGCRKAGMVCSEMCYHCMGVSCDNAPEMDLDSQ